MLIEATKSDLKTANLLVKWKEQEVKARTADVAMAKAAVDLKGAELELAKAKLISDSDSPVSEKYALTDYQDRLAQRLTEHGKAASRSQREGAKATELKTTWLKLANIQDVERFSSD